MNVRAFSCLFGVCLLLMPVVGSAQEGEQGTLESRYQVVVDTLVARLDLSDSVAVRFRGVVGTYLQESEEIFAKHQEKPGRESMEAMSKELAEARDRFDSALEKILTPGEIDQVRTIMDELRQRSAEQAEDG